MPTSLSEPPSVDVPVITSTGVGIALLLLAIVALSFPATLMSVAFDASVCGPIASDILTCRHSSQERRKFVIFLARLLLLYMLCTRTNVVSASKRRHRIESSSLEYHDAIKRLCIKTTFATYCLFILCNARKRSQHFVKRQLIGDKLQSFTFIKSATTNTSLSPRPDRFTTMTSLLLILLASFTAL